MKVVWTPRAKEDYLHWSKTDQKVLGAINILIKEIQRDPFMRSARSAAYRGANMVGKIILDSVTLLR